MPLIPFEMGGSVSNPLRIQSQGTSNPPAPVLAFHPQILGDALGPPALKIRPVAISTRKTQGCPALLTHSLLQIAFIVFISHFVY